MSEVTRIEFNFLGKRWYYNGNYNTWVPLFHTKWFVKVNEKGEVYQSQQTDPENGERPTAFEVK
ncbi:MAG: hypothetical protein ACOZAO_05960 [Patescibacteria group bacterium]